MCASARDLQLGGELLTWRHEAAVDHTEHQSRVVLIIRGTQKEVNGFFGTVKVWDWGEEDECEFPLGDV